MFSYEVKDIKVKNHGDACEFGVCSYYGINRIKHDSKPYNTNSDIELSNGKNISVKSNHFTLMSSALCEGLTSFDDIWKLYATNTHSNTFAYVTKTKKAYEMNLHEFKSFIYAFGTIEKDSAKNGGKAKIRCKAETKKMIEWLESQAK